MLMLCLLVTFLFFLTVEFPAQDTWWNSLANHYPKVRFLMPGDPQEATMGDVSPTGISKHMLRRASWLSGNPAINLPFGDALQPWMLIVYQRTVGHISSGFFWGVAEQPRTLFQLLQIPLIPPHSPHISEFDRESCGVSIWKWIIFRWVNPKKLDRTVLTVLPGGVNRRPNRWCHSSHEKSATCGAAHGRLDMIIWELDDDSQKIRDVQSFQSFWIMFRCGGFWKVMGDPQSSPWLLTFLNLSIRSWSSMTTDARGTPKRTSPRADQPRNTHLSWPKSGWSPEIVTPLVLYIYIYIYVYTLNINK